MIVVFTACAAPNAKHFMSNPQVGFTRKFFFACISLHSLRRAGLSEPSCGCSGLVHFAVYKAKPAMESMLRFARSTEVYILP